MTIEATYPGIPNPPPGYGMFGGGGTFVDLYSNTMVLRNLDLKEHIAELIRGELPVSLCLDAVHEMAHASCFISPVGAALALLGMRCSQLPFHARTGREVLSPLLKLTCAMALLKPVTEGLALFAEFDLYPGEGGISSPVTSWLLFFFSRPSVLSGTPVSEAMSSLIS